jgi:hypothetical protein
MVGEKGAKDKIKEMHGSAGVEKVYILSSSKSVIDTNCVYICPTTNFSKFILPVIKCLLSLISELEKQCDMGLNSLTNTLTILVKSSFLTEY